MPLNNFDQSSRGLLGVMETAGNLDRFPGRKPTKPPGRPKNQRLRTILAGTETAQVPTSLDFLERVKQRMRAGGMAL